MMPEISIIVSNYNTEKYLTRCLEGLLTQTFKEIEIIVIDDGSEDNSVDIIKKYATNDERIKLIQQQNAGPAKARNQGLENATGRYLMFCDSDDWYEPNMCQIMYDTIEKEKVDVVCCHNFFGWEENLSAKEKEERLGGKYYNPKKSGKHTLKDKTILSTNVLLWNKIWRRDIVEKYGIRFPEYHEHDDDAFWYMYAMVSKNVFYLSTPLYNYFIRSGSIMSNLTNKRPRNRMDRIAISEYVLDFILKHDLKKQKARLMCNIFRKQLSCCRPFFLRDELEELCKSTNLTIKNKLGVFTRIVYFKKVNKLRLLF
jgi:glycosyltransferase involved in cell wall biosynthesis